MAVYLGDTAIAAVYVGETAVQKIYLGDTQVWPAAAVAYSALGNGTYYSDSSYNFTHVAAAGDYVIVDANCAVSSTLTVTYGGTAMTLLGSKGHANTDSSYGSLRRYGITDATGGSKTVALSFGASKPNTSANSISYANVASVGTTTGYSAGADTISQQIACATGQLIVCGIGNCQTIVGQPTSSGGTSRWAAHNSGYESSFIRDATATTTFGGSSQAYTSWAMLATVLTP